MAEFIKSLFTLIFYYVSLPFSEIKKKRRKNKRQIERKKERCIETLDEIEHLKKRVSELERANLWNQIMKFDDENSKNDLIIELKLENEKLTKRNKELEKKCLFLADSITRYAKMNIE